MSAGITVHEGDEATGEFEAVSERIVLESATFGGRLRQERKRLAFTQQGLADLLQVSRKSIVRYEQDQHSPGVGFLLGMSQAGADVLYILAGQRSGDAPAPAANTACTLHLTREQRPFVAAAIMSWMDWLAEELTREQSPTEELTREQPPTDAEARERQARARQGLAELPRVLEQLWPDLNVRALLGSRAQ